MSVLGWVSGTTQPDVQVNAAIKGLADAVNVAGSSDYTLSQSEANNAILWLEGALTGNINLITFDETKIYAIYNGTTGSYSVTFKPSGGSGVVIPQNFTMLVYVDGFGGVWNLVDYMTSLKLGALTMSDGGDIALDTTTGSKVGTSTSQKLGFWNATPIVQPSSTDQASVTLGNTDGEIGGLTFSVVVTQGECEALRDKTEELADDVRNMHTLLEALRTALVNSGLAKGSA